MRNSPYSKPQLEPLETREAPANVGLAVLQIPPPTMPAPPPLAAPVLRPIINPTLAPANPTATNVAAAVVTVGKVATGTQNVTVKGLTPSNLQPGTPLQLSVAGVSYAVSSYTLNGDGSVRLTVSGGPALTAALQSNAKATVIVGGGGTAAPPTPAVTAPPISPIMNPTLAVQR